MIELLVVIAIIGLLASIILASLNTAQKKGRDARRVADTKEIQLALELYFDANNNYPIQGTALSATPSASNIPATLVPAYISQMPTDPSQPASGASPYYYQYESLGSDGVTACSSGTCADYVVIAHLEASWNSSSWGTALTTGSFNTLCPTTAPGTSPFPYCVHN